MTLETLAVGVTVGLCLAFLALLAWWSIRLEYQRYTDEQVREAKVELREYVREREAR